MDVPSSASQPFDERMTTSVPVPAEEAITLPSADVAKR